MSEEKQFAKNIEAPSANTEKSPIHMGTYQAGENKDKSDDWQKKKKKRIDEQIERQSPIPGNWVKNEDKPKSDEWEDKKNKNKS